MTIPEASPKILCAAIYIDDKIVRVNSPDNIVTGVVFCGRRHDNIMNQLAEVYPNWSEARKESTYTTGFLTTDNRYVSRKQAATIAYRASQITHLPKELYSEDLW